MGLDLQAIFKNQEDYVEQIIQDIRANNFSWEILQYANGYAQIEIDHYAFDLWNKEEYETGSFEHNEIRVHFGAIYRYIDLSGVKENDWENDDCEEEMLEWASEEDYGPLQYTPFNSQDYVR